MSVKIVATTHVHNFTKKTTVVVVSIEIYSLLNESSEWADQVGTRAQNGDGRSWKHGCEKRHNLCDQIEV